VSRRIVVLADRAWTWDYGIARALFVRLDDGALVVVSPPSGMCDAGWAEVEAMGTVRWLVAPNHFHTGGLAAWSARYPEAHVVAEDAAHARLRKVVPGLVVEGMATCREAMPPWVSLLAVPYARQGEVAVSLEGARRVWFVVDAIVFETHLTGLRGLLFRLLGFRTRLQRNPIFWTLFVSDRAGACAWWRSRLQEAAPDVFVPSHGRWIEDGAAGALRALFVDGGPRLPGALGGSE